MADINLITAPDRLYNDAVSFFLIYPSKDTKEQFNNLLANVDGNFNVYLYEHFSDLHEPDWLLTTANIVDFVIIDLDNCPGEIRDLGSYFVSKSNTYWLTSGEEMFYNKLSKNRIFNLDYFIDKIGGQIEKTTEQ